MKVPICVTITWEKLLCVSGCAFLLALFNYVEQCVVNVPSLGLENWYDGTEIKVDWRLRRKNEAYGQLSVGMEIYLMRLMSLLSDEELFRMCSYSCTVS